MKVKIIGAGSIGNHLAQACRRAGWDVSVVDTDAAALERMRGDIYPSRYGKWDSEIKLFVAGTEPKGGFDVIFVGTPPDTHPSIATDILRTEPPRVLQIEKPLWGPENEDVGAFYSTRAVTPDPMIVVGYDHVLGQNTKIAEQYIREGNLGKLVALDVEVREHWKGIFAAHPWLSGPEDTYLGFSGRGGGASGEHSHALNLWQHFAHVADAGHVLEISAVMDMVEDGMVSYDRQCFITLTTESGLVGRVVQDVITHPPEKKAVLRFENGSIIWRLGDPAHPGCDSVDKYDASGAHLRGEVIPKKRPDDFFREIQHIGDLLSGKISIKDSPIRLERGVNTINVLSAAHESHRKRRVIKR